MDAFLDLTIANLTSPMILFFALGLVAALVRSDLNVPEAVAKGMSLYLLLAIGFKGGVSLASQGLDATLFLALGAGIVLSALLPLLAFTLLMYSTKLPRIDAAAVAAHYGSISIVTFLAASEALKSAGVSYAGYMVAVAAIMETPAIMIGLWLARGSTAAFDKATVREVLFNGSILMLVGSFVIGAISGADGLKSISPFIVDPFKGVLCLFLLDMGLIAGRGLRVGRDDFTPDVVAFGIYMPLLGAIAGILTGKLIGLSEGGIALLATLSASASYIAVPAALRLALPEARTSLCLSLSLGITFPFNLAIGIPIYLFLASWIA
ncbi:MAG: sodium-dependent bicarbonate transport family permease [Pseudomonadota bacterium]